VAHFAFVCPPLAGHLNPMLAIGGALATRGHRVTFFCEVDAAKAIEHAGLGFCVVGEASHPAGTLAATSRKMARVNGLLGIFPIIEDMARTTAMLCTELPAAFNRHQVDAVVCDQLEAAGGLVAAHLALPIVSIANALLIDRDENVPPYFSHWLPDGSSWAHRRNKGAEDVSDLMMFRHARVVERHARGFGLGRRRTCNDCLSPALEISQIVRGFDFPRTNPPSQLQYTGPIRRDVVDAKLPFDLPAGKPLVFASFGTLFGGRFDLFEKVAMACRDLGAALIIAHGGRLAPSQVAHLEQSAIVAAFVPQSIVLANANACITHAGMNTMMDTLAAGVPALALPIAFDQPGVAARLVASGAGERVMPQRATVEALREALQRILSVPSYRQRAQELALEISAAGGVERAADLIEHSVFVA
jgi:zeaxanthin glucosyltransferase